MPVIKRYSNRKLYDTDAKQYVTLEDIADLIRQGEDVRVVDHVSGDDLTSVTLLQVVFEEQKKLGGLLPQVFLTRIIRAGGDTVSALRSRLAALDPFQVVDEEIRRRIIIQVEQGRISEEEALRLQDLLLRRSPQPAAVTIPVHGEEEPGASGPENVQDQPIDPQELEDLLRQVEALEQEVARLQHE